MGKKKKKKKEEEKRRRKKEEAKLVDASLELSVAATTNDSFGPGKRLGVEVDRFRCLSALSFPPATVPPPGSLFLMEGGYGAYITPGPYSPVKALAARANASCCG